MGVLRRGITFQINFIYYSAIVLGVCPFLYNREGKSVKRCRILELYSFCIHTTSFLVLNPLGFKVQKSAAARQFITKHFVLLIELFATEMKIISGLLSLLVFYKNRDKFECFINEILKLNSISFKIAKGERVEKWFICMVSLKIFVSGSIGWIHVSSFIQNFPTINWIIIGAFISSCCILTFHIFNVFYFYTAVGFLTKFFRINNENLEKIHEDFKFQRTPISQLEHKLQELTILYSKLFYLHTFLIKVYEIQIVSSLVTSFVGNVSAGFATYTLYHSEHVNWLAFGTYFILTTANYLDGYLTSVMCNRNCQFWRRATEILGQFSNLRTSGLDRAVSIRAI